MYASLMHLSYSEIEYMETSAVYDKLFTMRTDNEKKLKLSNALNFRLREE